MALREAASAPPAPGPSSEPRRLPVVLWRPASRGRQRQARIMDAGPARGAQWPRRASGPSGWPYAVFAWATHCGPLPTAMSLSTPLTRSAFALVFRGRPYQEAGASWSAFHGSMACLTCRLCSQITSRFVARAWPSGRSGAYSRHFVNFNFRTFKSQVATSVRSDPGD